MWRHLKPVLWKSAGLNTDMGEELDPLLTCADGDGMSSFLSSKNSSEAKHWLNDGDVHVPLRGQMVWEPSGKLFMLKKRTLPSIEVVVWGTICCLFTILTFITSQEDWDHFRHPPGRTQLTPLLGGSTSLTLLHPLLLSTLWADSGQVRIEKNKHTYSLHCDPAVFGALLPLLFQALSKCVNSISSSWLYLMGGVEPGRLSLFNRYKH